MTNAIDRVLGRLEGVRGHDGAWTALCPAHGDRNPSLSVAEADDGKCLLKCHAGCATEDIVHAMELRMSDLYPDNTSSGNGRGRGHGQQRREIIATYDYRDAGGKLLFQKVRFHPKGFRQRRPNGKSDWIWDLKGVKTVLYRLPQVIEAVKAGRRIYLCEGEKDADRLVKHGLDATTWTEGASKGKSKWKPRYTETLRGARVVLVPDNDEPGLESMRDIARALHGVAAEVRIIEWLA